MVAKTDCTFGEGNWKNNKGERKKKFKKIVLTKHLNTRLMKDSNLFTFFTDLKNFWDDFSLDILNLVNFLTLGPSSVDISKTSNISTNPEILNYENNSSPSKNLNKSYIERFLKKEVQLSSATIRNNRYEWIFVTAKVINLCKHIYLNIWIKLK